MRTTLDKVSAIAGDFSERYEILIANTETLRRQVYRVRHEVFCDELGYDMRNVSGHEFDDYDSGSLHVLLRQRDNGNPIGCFRLVMPLEGSDVWLPFDRYGVPHVDERLFDWSRVNRARSVEVSRLALSAKKRQCGANEGGPSDPYMATAMFYAVTALVLKLGTEDLFVVIEPRLGRLISRYGFSLDQISPPFEYYGQRATFSAYRSRIIDELANLKTPWRNLYDIIEKQLFGELATHTPPRPLATPLDDKPLAGAAFGKLAMPSLMPSLVQMQKLLTGDVTVDATV